MVVNSVRLSRGPWRIAASADKDGLVCSQQFLGLWPHNSLSEIELLTYVAILNGPLANAFLAVNSPAKGIRISAFARIPVPPQLPLQAGELVGEYLRLLDQSHEDAERFQALLTQIDAAVLRAFDLPARLERQLLDYSYGAKRPVIHPWEHWNVSYPAPSLTLSERLSGRYQPYGSWVQKIFHPLPTQKLRCCVHMELNEPWMDTYSIPPSYRLFSIRLTAGTTTRALGLGHWTKPQLNSSLPSRWQSLPLECVWQKHLEAHLCPPSNKSYRRKVLCGLTLQTILGYLCRVKSQLG